MEGIDRVLKKFLADDETRTNVAIFGFAIAVLSGFVSIPLGFAGYPKLQVLFYILFIICFASVLLLPKKPRWPSF